jgi:hypothetical protein
MRNYSYDKPPQAAVDALDRHLPGWRDIIVKGDRDINKQAEDWWQEGGEDHVGEDLEG